MSSTKWGVKGLKIDFMQRDDQKLINFYYKTCREAAKRHMLVDFHGGQSQVTMTRTWPNMISGEGVRGLEWSKWSAETEPQHNVTLPFTRMFLGPMDFTPGAMLNASKANFAAIHDRPMSLGTRCHQLGMYVVFESPLQMLSDSPSNYMREPEAMEFLAPVPSVWDDTKVLDANIAEYVLVARRSGKDWYVGAMTNWTARDLQVDFSFLPAGTFWLEAYQDGVNADRMASDYKKTRDSSHAGHQTENISRARRRLGSENSPVTVDFRVTLSGEERFAQRSAPRGRRAPIPSTSSCRFFSGIRKLLPTWRCPPDYSPVLIVAESSRH